ncbi:MAG: ribonuclease HII [Alphaproteobacteria bacterium]|nr:ribonuclease HII [Alphaproteobacteria bacterium]
MPDFELEDEVLGEVIGVDEAGRGPWVGPVVAGSVVFLKKEVNPFLLENLNDSKKISKKKREILYDLLREEQKLGNIKIGIGQASAKEIDELNILNATFLAMKRAISQCEIEPVLVLIDGNRLPKNFEYNAKAVVKGDAKSYSISAASIVAKVYRDKLMEEMALKYPNYGFEKNAGYGTKEHIEALKKYGITPEHRKSYAPIKEFCNV